MSDPTSQQDEAAQFTLEVVSTREGVEALADDWRRLDAVTSVASIFRTWEWMEAWLHAVEWKRRLHVVVIRDTQKQVAAIAPLMIGAHGAYDRGDRIVSFIGSDGPQGGSYMDLIAAPGWEGRAHLAVVGHLRDHMKEFSYINLNRVALDDPAFNHWSAAALECDLHATVDLRRRTVWSPLPATYDEYVAAVPNKRWRQRMRNFPGALAREFPSACFVDRGTGSPLEGVLADLRRLQEARWEEGSTYWQRPGFPAYIHRLCRSLQSAGRLRAIFLMVNDRPVSARLGLIHRGTWIDFQAGRDPSFKEHDVAYLTLWHCAEKAIAERLTRMDSLDEYEYKRRYFRQTRWLADLRFYDDRFSSAGRQVMKTAGRAARRTVKGLLPGKLLRLLRK